MTNNLLNWRVWLILLVYLGLAVAYSIVTPIGRGADEWAHYWYAQFIADNGRLPASPAEREAAGYKSDWPPLYHLAAAAMTGWIETDGPPAFKYRADSIRRQLIPAQGPEAIVHTEDELFPWQQEILVWHLGRFLSIGFSVGTLIVTYFVALEVFSGRRVLGAGFRAAGSQGRKGARKQGGRGVEEQGSRGAGVQESRGAEEEETQHSTLNTQHSKPETPTLQSAIRNPHSLALAATAILAFNPRFLFTSMLFNYDSLTLLISSLFLWLAIRVARNCHLRWGFWGLGALAGLALVTKYLTLLLPLVILFVAMVRGAGLQRVPGARKQRDKGAEDRDIVASSQGRSKLKTQNSKLKTQNFSLAIRNSQFLIRSLAQATIAYILVTGWWFAYLIITFNEVERYGPLLGTLAPLLRGDGSDRTVEAIFAWLSGGQAPPPAYIEQQSYSAWQISSSFFTTFWGNPIVQPYPLNWFIVAMTAVMGLALIGLIFHLRFTIYDLRLRHWQFTIHNSQFTILLFTCLLPVPFMLVRLFGARDALEAVQGRHILFLAGPAVAILIVLGLSFVICHLSFVIRHSSSVTRHASRITFYTITGLLLTGAIAQLIFMATAYPPPAPVHTMPATSRHSPFAIRLPGGAELITYSLLLTPYSLQVDLLWRGGDDFAPEDYRTELALLNAAGEVVSGWTAYQTQVRYPTRVWEPGDIVRDTGWLPLAGLPAGDYTVQWRLLGGGGPLFEWQTLKKWSFVPGHSSLAAPWIVWRNGLPAQQLPAFSERETIQLTNYELRITNYELIGPKGKVYSPVSTGPGWSNFIVQPHWPAGDYRLGDEVALRVAENRRNFHLPADAEHPLDVNFEGKIKLLGYDLPTRRVEPGSGLPVTLYWQGLDWLGEEFVIFTRLLDNQGFAWGGYDRLAKENYSTLLWAPGEIIVDGFALPVEPDTPDGVYTLSIGWYRRVDGQAESLLIVNPETGEPTDETAVSIGPIKVGGPPPGATIHQAQPQTATNTIFGDQIKLLGFDLNNSTLTTQNLELSLYWQALRQPDADYTMFVHVRDKAGEIVTQKDQPPLGGAYPTGLWNAGELIPDQLAVPLDGVGPGRYQLVVGLYDLATGQRLLVEGRPDGTVLLDTIEVTP